MALVFQSYALYPHLNAADNIAFGLRIHRESKEHFAASVEEVGCILGLGRTLPKVSTNVLR